MFLLVKTVLTPQIVIAKLHSFSKGRLALIPALPLHHYTDPMITLWVVLNLLAMLQAQVEPPLYHKMYSISMRACPQ